MSDQSRRNKSRGPAARDNLSRVGGSQGRPANGGLSSAASLATDVTMEAVNASHYGPSMAGEATGLH